MVQKMSGDGEMLVYAVERKTGAPRAGASVQVIRGKDDITKGATDQQGILRTRVVKKQAAGAGDEEGGEEAEGEEAAAEEEAATDERPYLVTATSGEDFAISDLNSFYFEGGDGEGGEGQRGREGELDAVDRLELPPRGSLATADERCAEPAVGHISAEHEQHGAERDEAEVAREEQPRQHDVRRHAEDEDRDPAHAEDQGTAGGAGA
jgi:hypothetical protein